MRIILLGSSEMLAAMIDGVRLTGSEIVGVMNWREINRNWLNKLLHSDYTQKKIKALNLPVIKARSANSEEFKKAALALNPDLIIVGTWGEKIKKEIFDLPKLATVNLHPSLLPKYRGPNPYTRAIMYGETKSGITAHLMNEKFDRGPILLQKEVEILRTDNSKVLKTRICSKVPELCAELITKFNSEIIMPINQEEAIATYYPHIKNDEIIVEPHKMTYEEIHNRIRALAPVQSTYLLYRNEYFKIYDYNVSQKYIKTDKCNLCLRTKDDKFIYFKNLRALGRFKKHFTATILNYLHK